MTTPDPEIVIIGGFGHIGLPLCITLADAGLQVGLLDIDQSKRKDIEAGRMPFTEHGAEEVLQRVIGKTLHVADGLEALQHARTTIITIGTPLDAYMNPDLGPIFQLAEDMSPHLPEGAHIVLRSTVYPGTTRRLQQAFEAAGADVHLSFCPERIIQGYAIQEIETLPQIISGITEEAQDMSRDLFDRLGVTTVDATPEEAELAKLFCNAWRYTQFAAANQFYMVAERMGVDFEQVRRVMTQDYARMDGFPKAGLAAGPCLLKDTMQLAAFSGNNMPLGHAAMLVNEGLPNFIVDELLDGVDLKDRTVGILGMAFKADIDDGRDSLSYKLAKLLRFRGAQVLCTDPHVEDPDLVPLDQVLDQADLWVLATPHTVYKDLTVPEGVQVVDVWGTLGGTRL